MTVWYKLGDTKVDPYQEGAVRWAATGAAPEYLNESGTRTGLVSGVSGQQEPTQAIPL
eukprot:CAMPEP_0196663720 /NCGR_PEP_ID=MMETSP1086-20130531/53969_1 /TAXON_ID=77921 /ORGANISM="Cyanoptyche  gloeocystis , Strain SAG4.97" /LENGTH=57 /DNA_ID=CAMNT_0041999639 /DNA_START=141 /DNA_END=315 /DNA_ORIENTATION=+